MKDEVTHSIDRQFLFGNALLISPVLTQGSTSVNVYFPNDTWYSYYTGELINKRMEFTDLDAPLDLINIHVRGGFIVPWQHPAITTTQSRLNTFGLLVALKENDFSNGSLFWDDGETFNAEKKNIYNLFEFTASKGSLIVYPKLIGYQEAKMILNDIKIFGVDVAPINVTINGNLWKDFEYENKVKHIYILI
jgi:alpha-glucosidase (family GH31 glycosyl hydrolase)